MEENILNHYTEGYYNNFEYGFKNIYRLDHKRILSLEEFVGKEVVDIGCGLGTLLRHLKSFGAKAVGIESNEYAVNFCNDKNLDVILHSDVSRLPFVASSKDIIVLNEIIEHLLDPSQVLQEVWRILKPGGSVIITTPKKDLLVRNLDPSHYSELGYKQLRNLMIKSGFEIQIHEVSGLNIYDLIGRKLLFPVGRLLIKFKFLEDPVSTIRKRVDSSIFSNFRRSLVFLGIQQLLKASKKI